MLKVEALGYVNFSDEKGGVGRPKRHYFISPAGQESFPKQYSWLSNVLLGLLADDLGEAGIAKLMKSLAIRVAESMKERFGKKLTTPELLREVTLAMNELGYRAFLRQSDLRKGAVLEATNCVYHSVAKQHPALCQFDTRFLESATRLNVRLESCIARGDSVCRFCLSKPKAKAVL
jgi:predicted ArsR family transcriptional regulator